MTKVKLPPKVAAALDKVREKHRDIDYIAWKIPQEDCIYTEADRILYDYARKASFIDLVNALQYGYEACDPKEAKIAEIIRSLPNMTPEEIAALIVREVIDRAEA
ncbi:hypothetical protein PACILC2_34650 [Paenibacillus cisolokensis]|uniref:Phage protein n=1 Tax=Paenibacillus cisolokensis TaxID=1658519 RepID=A0ABQ4N9J1_9BACL|nr:hypothetical protein [Paenibacillus cisolokensis]GIQ64897.1 hypothetical protein PACILC2_34650 [Paenibacillus cisolokensis]